MEEKKGLQGLEEGIKKVRSEVERFVKNREFDKILKKQDFEKFVRREFLQTVAKTSKELRLNLIKDLKKEIEATRKVLKADFDKFAKEVRNEIQGEKAAPKKAPKAKSTAKAKGAPKKAAAKKTTKKAAAKK